MRCMLIALPAIALAGCSMGGGGDVASTGPSGGACDASNTAEFIGQKTSVEIGAAIQKRTGATIFQWVPPRTAVTMDYRENRVRVSYDDDMVIERITCG